MKSLPCSGEDLVLRLKNSDNSESWNEFYEFYLGLILRTARRHGVRWADAYDVAQETMIAIVDSVSRFANRPDGCLFTPWVLRIAQCKIALHVRSRDIA